MAEFKVYLKNNKVFTCDNNTTIFEAAKASGVALEHSCLTARCRSCVVKVTEGETENKLDENVLSESERAGNFVLSCNTYPKSDLVLDIEDLGDITLFEKKIVPAKINTIEKLSDNIIKVCLRLPPAIKFEYNSGQYVNLIKGGIKRSYSIANAYKGQAIIEFFIKNYENGQMSNYIFNEAKVNDLLRMEGPLGSFFLREASTKNIIFLATGTGVAPIKAILENIRERGKNLQDKTFWLFFGARYEEDIFWTPNDLNIPNLTFVKVLSREVKNFDGFKGYVQDAVLNQNIDLSDSQVYACGSFSMIESAKKTLMETGLEEHHFFSDAFVQTN
jgi:CDP-4-dehydro-6-deoxyglucose reductase